MAESLSERLQTSRLTVVEIMKEAGRIRVKGAAEGCTEIACGAEAVVEATEGPSGGLDALQPGDLIRLEPGAHGHSRVVVVRRVWDELGSPEF
jgi:xanthine dehydrogenase iron-sulfur cluster and FAD-binding subunit A